MVTRDKADDAQKAEKDDEGQDQDNLYQTSAMARDGLADRTETATEAQVCR